MSITALREDALRMIANGKTAAELAARAADPSNYDHYRTAEGLRAHGGKVFAAVLTSLFPGDDLAAEMAGFDARIATEMAALEAEGFDAAAARAALRKAAAA